MKYIAFDVETPNSKGDRMSAIGITVVENGMIQRELYSLVNPETYFNRFNVELTGITPEMVENEPTFPQLWEKIEPVMSGGLLIAHNAPFDMSVLAKCLRAYEILWKPAVSYACTVQMGRRLLPKLENHRLNTMCDYFSIELDHHHAGSDSRACAELLLRYLQGGARIEPFLRQYDMVHSCTCKRSVGI